MDWYVVYEWFNFFSVNRRQPFRYSKNVVEVLLLVIIFSNDWKVPGVSIWSSQEVFWKIDSLISIFNKQEVWKFTRFLISYFRYIFKRFSSANFKRFFFVFRVKIINILIKGNFDLIVSSKLCIKLEGSNSTSLTFPHSRNSNPIKIMNFIWFFRILVFRWKFSYFVYKILNNL